MITTMMGVIIVIIILVFLMILVYDDQKVSNNMILMSKYKGKWWKGVNKFGQGSLLPFSGDALKKLIFLMGGRPL